MRRFLWIFFLFLTPPPLLLTILLSGCASVQKPMPILQTVPVGSLTWTGDLPVLHLRGTPYEMGYQHGSLLRREVRASVKNILAFANHRLGMPGVGRFFVRRRLDRTWRRMKPRVPEKYLDEMEGLADGAGIPLVDLERIHAIPELTALSPDDKELQRYAVLIERIPSGGQPFTTRGWLGFIRNFNEVDGGKKST